MSKVNIKRRDGQQGLASTEVATTCGIHKNMVSNGTLFNCDSGGAVTENILTATTNCTIQRAVFTVNEAIAAIATFNVGKINGLTTTAGHFVSAFASDAAVAAGTQIELTLANTALVAGDTLTVSDAGGSGAAGTGWITVEYTIDDEPTP